MSILTAALVTLPGLPAHGGAGDGMAGMPGMGGTHTMSGPMWMPTEPPTFWRILAPHVQPVPILPVLTLLALGAYVAGVVAVRRRGGRWPWWRTAVFSLGAVLLLAATSTGIEGYGMVLFSVHMAQHMMLAMMVPILLLVGAPITLALRALPGQGRGSGLRRGIVSLMGSRFMKVLTSIPVRWLLFLSGLYGIYFTPIFDHLMSSVWGHNLMLAHFLATGLLFFGPLVAADPLPGKGTPLTRLVEAFAGTPFHAFFGIAVMSSSSLITTFFADPPASWGIDPLHDQSTAGGIAWATSELPTLLLAGVILAQWFASDQREAKRHDRTADRTADAELNAYNARLAAMAGRRPAAQQTEPPGA